jgi:hypothetical protein
LSVRSVYTVNSVSNAAFEIRPGVKCAAPNRARSAGVARNPPPAHLYAGLFWAMFAHLPSRAGSTLRWILPIAADSAQDNRGRRVGGQ